MAVLSQIEITKLLQKFNITTQHALGQNFLIDPEVLQLMVDTWLEEPTQTVLEVGPGLGALTTELVQYAKRVISVELDRQLLPVLQTVQHKWPHLEIINGSILNQDLAKFGLKSGEFSVAANLPYQITAHFLRQLLTQAPWPNRMVLLVQKEVAERMIAPAGSMSLLGLSVQLFSEPELIAVVPSTAFWPKPKVHSAIVALNHIHARSMSEDLERKVFALAKAGFAQRRKLLASNLSGCILPGGSSLTKEQVVLALQRMELSPLVRAQNLSVADWLTLVDILG